MTKGTSMRTYESVRAEFKRNQALFRKLPEPSAGEIRDFYRQQCGWLLDQMAEMERERQVEHDDMLREIKKMGTLPMNRRQAE